MNRLSLPILLLLAGCTVGPDYVAPVPEVPESFGATPQTETATPVDGAETSAPEPDGRWWSVLGDPGLDRLVELAVTHNQDLEAARARVRQSRALRRATAARGRPQLGGRAGGDLFQGSSNEPGANAALAEAGLTDLDGERTFYELGASWEIDVFGGVRRAREAADARLEASVEGRRGVLLGVIAEVVRNHSEWQGAERRRALAEKNLALAEQTLARVEARHRAGLASGLDAARARAEVAATAALVPPLRAASHAAHQRLATLTGGALRNEDSPSHLTATPWSELPALVPTGLPSDLLRRRPDVRSAERRLAAASAEIGVRTADQYPRFFLTGGRGGSSSRFTDLFESASRTWRLGPRFSWPIYQGGRLEAGVDAARSGYAAVESEYRQTVLRAIEEVEVALVRYAERELQRRALAEAVDAGRRASTLARALYDQGLSDYLPVLDAERSLTDLEDRLTASETGVVTRLVALYAALGGGWQVFETDRYGADLEVTEHHSVAASEE